MRWKATLAVFASGVLIVAGRANPAGAVTPIQPSSSPRVAVLHLGEVRSLRPDVSRVLSSAGMIVVTDSLADAAVRGVGYEGSLNPTRDEVRRLAAAIGAEILVLGASSIAERETPDPERRWDAFAGLFLVNGRSGNLLRYKGLSAFAPERDVAERQLRELAAAEAATWSGVVPPTESTLNGPPNSLPDRDFVDFVALPEGTADKIPPRFFSRPVPAYTADADRIHATATVELLVEFLDTGEYGRIDVVRWAGFGLDESAVAAVRASKFWPARLKGRLVPAKAILRFNFRFRSDGTVSSRPCVGAICNLVAGRRGNHQNPER